MLTLGAFYLFVGSVVGFIFLRICGIKEYRFLCFGIESRAQEARLQSQTQEIYEGFEVFSDSAMLNTRFVRSVEILINKLFGLNLQKSVQQFMYIQDTLLQSQSTHNAITLAVRLKYTIALILFGLSFIPLHLHQDQDYNTFEVAYAFFDTPSVFCMLLCGLFIARSIFSDALRFSWVGAFIESTMRCKDSTLLILCLFGAVLYLGVLNLLPFDVYHLGIWQSGLITLGVIVFISLLDCIALLLLFFTLCVFVFCGSYLSLAEFIICPYLWIYSVIFTCIYGIQRIFAHNHT